MESCEGKLTKLTVWSGSRMFRMFAVTAVRNRRWLSPIFTNVHGHGGVFEGVGLAKVNPRERTRAEREAADRNEQRIDQRAARSEAQDGGCRTAVSTERGRTFFAEQTGAGP